MGDPKRLRKQYDKPSHPWQRERIEEERELVRKYGLKNKRELWKAQTQMRKFRQKARSLIARGRTGEIQAEKEKDQLLGRLANLSILPDNASLDDVLALNLERILERRLQTIVVTRGLAHTPKQARQFIVHGHTSIGDRKVTIPSYLVKKHEEDVIVYNLTSPLANDLHPMRPRPKIGNVEHIVPKSEEPVKQKIEGANK